jgi:biotin operon repressor
MTYLERKKKEEYLLYLIEKERFYSLEKIAENYGCSVRTVKRMIFNLREEGNRIIYSKKNNKYFLEK